MTGLALSASPPAGRQLPRSVRDRIRITRAMSRLRLPSGYTLAQARRAYLAAIHTVDHHRTNSARDLALCRLNAYLVAKAAVLSLPLPPSRTRKFRGPRPVQRRPEPVAVGSGARDASLGPWWWRW